MSDFPQLGEYNGQFVHPRLAVGGCPFPPHVPAFISAGIRGIVDARSAFYREHISYLAALPADIHWMLLGTWDGCYVVPHGQSSGRPNVPTTVDPAYADFLVEATMHIVRDHSPVLIHCGGGIGRSGNLAAIAYAALENCTVQEAIERMKVYRPVLAGWSEARWGCDGSRLVDLAKKVLASHDCLV